MTELPPVDPGNPFLNQPYPSLITHKILPAHPANVLALTMRCGPGTLTAMLLEADAVAWHQHIGRAITELREGALVVPPPSAVPGLLRPPHVNGRPHPGMNRAGHQ